ncbi:MAG: ABC transporter ATP-binding protein [Patescibacteria group bacterium]
MNKEILRLEGVGKSFGEKNKFLAVKKLNISVNNGEFACILGPSGCGKTIILRLVAGFLRPTMGRILLDSQEITKPGTDRILIFQDYILFPWMTVRRNIMFGAEKSGLSQRQKETLTNKYLKLVGLTKFKNWYIHNLSGGMKQRVAIARALISNPKVLLMDEPFAALDSQSRKYMRASLEKIWQKTKKTVIFVTHSINEALILADTIYLLSDSPARVIRTYKINLPRPRSQYDFRFVKIAKDIERKIAKEFKEFKL